LLIRHSKYIKWDRSSSQPEYGFKGKLYNGYMISNRYIMVLINKTSFPIQNCTMHTVEHLERDL